MEDINGGVLCSCKMCLCYHKSFLPTPVGNKKSQLIFMKIMKEKKNKSSYVRIRCYPEEKEQIREYAKEFGLNISEYILRKSLQKPTNMNYKEVIQSIHVLRVELGRSGNNINQFTKSANIMMKMGGIHEKVFCRFEKELREHVKIRVLLHKEIRKLISLLLR